ncbi:hypothetical protein NDA13_001120 [Ustilago tritici]|nr:hypothetical protein NDA13_001120 [Ustilago tritici]
MAQIKYQRGFGNHFISEAKPDSLPKFGHSPQKVNHGLYTEQLSGTAFTAARAKNQRSWLYRIRPSVNHQPFHRYKQERVLVPFHAHSPDIHPTPQQLRWDPLVEHGPKDVDFVDGLVTLAGAGDTQLKNGIALHTYTATKGMRRRSFYNSDGDLLIRGIKFSVDFDAADSVSMSNPAFGYICETFKGHFELPDLGAIGANGLANPEDFETPTALYQDTTDNWTVINKFMDLFFSYNQTHSPYDVVAFSGNYVPYRYDLTKFNTIGSISYDHPDPSIFTVLTCPTDTHGTAVCDFVIFPPRWLVADDTFRPPSTETACGASLHNRNSAHGPDAETFDKASNAPLKPAKVGEGSMSFMFESAYQLATTKYAIEESGKVQQVYCKAWTDLKKNFKE